MKIVTMACIGAIVVLSACQPIYMVVDRPRSPEKTITICYTTGSRIARRCDRKVVVSRDEARKMLEEINRRQHQRRL